jgi:hypothetical protein
MTAALDPDEGYVALAGSGPLLAFGGTVIVGVGVGTLRPCGEDHRGKRSAITGWLSAKLPTESGE